MHLPWRDVRLTEDGPPISTSVQDVEIAELQRLAAGSRVVEVGSAFGYSAIGMALAGAKYVIAVDPHMAHASFAQMKANAEAYGVRDVIEPLVGTSEVMLPILEAGGYDLAFIDGDHTHPGCAYDIQQAKRLVRPGGAIAVHDYGEDCCCPGVRSAFDAEFRSVPDSWYGTLHGTLYVVEVP